MNNNHIPGDHGSPEKLSAVPVRQTDPSVSRQIKPVEDYDILPLSVERILVEPSSPGSVILLFWGTKTIAYGLTAAETSALTFVRSGLSSVAHIRPLYALYYATMREGGATLDAAVIESKVGDIFYARLKWKDRQGRPFYATVSVGDALLMAALAEIDISIVRRVFDEWEEFDWPYESRGTYLGGGDD